MRRPLHRPFPLICSTQLLQDPWAGRIWSSWRPEMKNSLLKFVLAAFLILNLTVFSTAGYRYYQQSRSWVSPFGKVMEKNRFLFEELSLKPEQVAAMKTTAIPFRAEIDRRR